MYDLFDSDLWFYYLCDTCISADPHHIVVDAYRHHSLRVMSTKSWSIGQLSYVKY
jgi:hypothetical protein